jgi:hypothetical protein
MTTEIYWYLRLGKLSKLIELTKEFWQHDIYKGNNLLRRMGRIFSAKLTPIKNPMNGKRVTPRKARESSLGGRFSGALKMWVISALGPNLEYWSTGCRGGRGAFSGASGRSSSTWPTSCKKEFSWKRIQQIFFNSLRKYTREQSWDKKNAYHDSITNSELNVISAREIEKLLNQSKKIL